MTNDVGRIADATGLSQAELVARLGPSGFDPLRWASALTPQEQRYLIATPLQEPAGAGFIARRADDFCGHGTPFSGFARRRPTLFQVSWRNPCQDKRLYRLSAAGVAARDAALALAAARPTIESLRRKVEIASQRGPDDRPSLGSMTHAERDEYLFGITASAIEARSDATPESDAAEGESAVPNGETPSE